jgi:elongator complex protein 3
MLKSYDKLVRLAIKRNPVTPEAFLDLKKALCKKLNLKLPTNADLREVYEKMVAKKKIRRHIKFEKILKTRGIRTQSGVAIVAVLTKPYPCPGNCLYCPTEKNMPKSYLSNEPAVMRAIASQFDPYRQVQNRLRSLELNGHDTDKIELIVMGGTFSFLPKAYQLKFISECFQACNEYKGKVKSQKSKVKITEKNLFKEQTKNERAKHRIIGLTLETRPDYINEKEILNFRKLGCTRVELGVQGIFDPVLKINRRGHWVKQTIKATKLLKDAGFKINYHLMPGLPGSSLKKDYQMFQTIFKNPDFQPDIIKIYPTIVVKNSDLYKLWKNGKYKPLTDRQFENFILKVKNNLIPSYVRITRLVRDVPTTSILAGPKISNLRQLISKNSKCPCIRCREVRSDYNIREKIILDRIDYPASGGQEIFLQYVSTDRKKLFALLRLRIPSLDTFIPVLKNSAIIREVHTYGNLIKISHKDKTSPQHIGLGKKLIAEAEKIANKEFNVGKIVVISGVGVRDYYKKLGYRQKDTYMVKEL